MTQPSPPQGTPVDLANPQVLLAWQRNHLANERTFLAWCRTAVALFAFSFVIERFDFFIRQIQHISGFEAMAKRHIHLSWSRSAPSASAWPCWGWQSGVISACAGP